MSRPIGLLLIMVAATFLAASPVFGQFATIRGHVTEATGGRALPGATVILRGLQGNERGVTAGANGRFELRRVSPGRYVLTVRFVGFKSSTDTLDVAFDQTIDHPVALEAAEQLLDEILVEEDAREAPIGAGLQTISPASLARVPMPDVSYDLAGYLLTLPGFVQAGDRGGQLFVRGGTPTQNLVLVDGIPIYQPFHIIGFYSAFPADIVAFADVYAGGFGARYGGRISSVIDISTVTGDKSRLRGSVSIAPFLSSIGVQIPVVPGRVSLLASFRESVIERIAPDLLGKEMPFRFGDRFVKLHAFLTPTSSLHVTGLMTFDEGDVGSTDAEPAGGVSRVPVGDDSLPSSWRNEAFGYRYSYLPSDYPVRAQVAMHYSRMESRYRPPGGRPQEADVSGYTMEIDFDYLFRYVQVHFGLYGTMNRFHYDLGSRLGRINSGVSSGGAYFETRFDLGRIFRIEPSVRIETFSRGIRTNIDPRVRASLLLFGGRQQWSAAWGRYHQQIVGLNNEQDVSDVFTVWAASPHRQPVPESIHRLLGVRNRINAWIDLSVEAYDKSLANLSFPVFTSDPTAVTGFARVDGSAQGVDIRLETTRRRWYMSIGYSLARIRYTWRGGNEGTSIIPGLTAAPVEGGVTFSPPHDRRHQLNIMGQVTSGPWSLLVRWQFGSGLPFTQIKGFYREYFPSADDPAAFHDADGLLRVSRATPFGSRLPAYHRLDLSIERLFTFPKVNATLQFGLLNAYDRANLFEYNFVTGQRVDQLPLIPSVGLKVAIK